MEEVRIPGSETCREIWEEEISRRLPVGALGAVMARAGVGKTAFLVQLAISQMLGGQDSLYVSLHEPIAKVTLWYRELFEKKFRDDHGQNLRMLWETILPHRFIMTFRVDSFSIPNLEERLNDLIVQDIFHPRVLFLDGWQTDRIDHAALLELKDFAGKNNLHVWMSVHIHRQESGDVDPFPAFLQGSNDYFDILLKMEDGGRQIRIDTLKDSTESLNSWVMKMDPVTLLVTTEKAG